MPVGWPLVKFNSWAVISPCDLVHGNVLVFTRWQEWP